MRAHSSYHGKDRHGAAEHDASYIGQPRSQSPAGDKTLQFSFEDIGAGVCAVDDVIEQGRVIPLMLQSTIYSRLLEFSNTNKPTIKYLPI